MLRFLFACLFFSSPALAELPPLTKQQNNVTQTFGLNNRLNTPMGEYMMAFSNLYALGLPALKQKYDPEVILSVYTLTQFKSWRKPDVMRRAAATLKDPCITELGGINIESAACEKAMLASYLLNKSIYEKKAQEYFRQLAYGEAKSAADDVFFYLMDYYVNNDTPQHKRDMTEMNAIMNSP